MKQNFSGIINATVSKELYEQLNKSSQEIEFKNDADPNSFIIMKTEDDGKSLVARVKKDNKIQKHRLPSDLLLPPRNKEQAWSYELLYDPSVKFVTLTGPAGTGKTLLAIAAGLQQLNSLYSKMIVSRPIIPLGKDLGFLPGTLEEKMEPWIAPIRDNLAFIEHNARKQKANIKKTKKRNLSVDSMINKELIEIEALSYIRGRSIPDAFIIIDEAQNLDDASLKTIITRAGDNTKIVLTGDTEQVDIKVSSCGLNNIVEKFRPYEIAGHISLIKGERSALATLAAQIL